MESADLCCSKWLWRGSQHTAQALPPILGTNIARSNTLEIVAFNICFFFLLFFYFLCLSINFITVPKHLCVSMFYFVRIFSIWILWFPQAVRERHECVMRFISIARSFLIQLLHILKRRGSGNHWGIDASEASKTKNNWLFSNSCRPQNNLHSAHFPTDLSNWIWKKRVQAIHPKLRVQTREREAHWR